MTTVLVIEDELPILEAIVRILQYHHFDVIGAENGLVGVQMARLHLPDVIICDIVMPKLDGYGVLLQLSDDPVTAAIPFIFLTAIEDWSDMRRSMELGADDYITKPCSPQDLLTAINTRLNKQESMRDRYQQQMSELREGIVHALPHELRTPLASILGYSSILADDTDTLSLDELRDIGIKVGQAATRLHRQIENYLLYAQLELAKVDPAGQGDVIMEGDTVSPAEVTQQMALRRASDDDREADLILNLVNSPVRIAEVNLQKILRELLDNAFKFSESGTPVQVKASLSSNAWLLSITDHGRGMTTDQITGIGAYMQFQRKLYEQQGSGLGLTIARDLAELHEGQLAITSSPGKYTTVQLKLPRVTTG
ncbi:MAG: response regulator [Anaerolineae bacterium]|nr:response regulator [Anaerolineae bacterium]